MKLLRKKTVPTAVFCFNDELCAGVLQALYAHSELRVPADISLVGFDDVFWTELTHPPLTTVHIEKVRMAREAVERLTRAIEKQDLASTATIVPTRLVVRESTAKPIQGKRK
jgi:DNA-binding LacI/PurR family transcriptional regulator